MNISQMLNQHIDNVIAERGGSVATPWIIPANDEAGVRDAIEFEFELLTLADSEDERAEINGTIASLTRELLAITSIALLCFTVSVTAPRASTFRLTMDGEVTDYCHWVQSASAMYKAAQTPEGVTNAKLVKLDGPCTLEADAVPAEKGSAIE